MTLLKAYLWNLVISIDQFLNTLAFGDPDETLSSRMGKAVKENRCRLCHVACWLIGKFDPDHCNKTIEPDEGQKGIF